MKKQYIKTNLIIFIFAHILTLSVGVYAAVTFPSNEVSYSNIESGLNSTNVQGAIDELYETCTKEPTAGEQIIENAGLEKDQYECRYFFTGKNPNNYVTFNEEKWQIISVECDGTIKIMRKAKLSATREWDTGGGTNGLNDWNRPADLNTFLNNTYLKNRLDAISQSQIVSKDWGIGVVTWQNDDLVNQINDENSNKWSGKVALITVSEYIRSNSNKSSCGTFASYNKNYSSCLNTTWMYNSNIFMWTLSPYNGVSSSVLNVYSNGSVAGLNANSARAIRPTVYLSSKIKITDGTGTSTDPYQISL